MKVESGFGLKGDAGEPIKKYINIIRAGLVDTPFPVLAVMRAKQAIIQAQEITYRRLDDEAPTLVDGGSLSEDSAIADNEKKWRGL